MTCKYCSNGKCTTGDSGQPGERCDHPDESTCRALVPCAKCGKRTTMLLPENSEPDGENCSSCSEWLCRECYDAAGGCDGGICPVCGGEL